MCDVNIHRGTHTSLYWLSYLYGHAWQRQIQDFYCSFSFFLTSRDLPISLLFVTSSEVEMERVGAGSVWAWSGL